MQHLSASGLDEARLTAPLGRRRAPRAPRPAAVPQAAAAASGGGSGGEVQKLHAFLSASPAQQQQQGLSAADAYQGALPAPMVEDWSRLRVRRHMRLRRIEVDLPPALAQQHEQQHELQAQYQPQLAASEGPVEQQVAAAQQAAELQPVQAEAATPAAEAASAELAELAAGQLPLPAAEQQHAAVQAAAPQQQLVQQHAAVQAAVPQQQVVQQQAVQAVAPQQQAVQQPVVQAPAPEQQQGFALPHVSTEQLSSMASGAAGRVARLAQQTQVAAQGAAAEAATLGQQQLASLQQLTAHQMGNLQQAAGHARKQLVAGTSRLQAKVQPQQAGPAPTLQQPAATMAAEGAAQTAAAASQAPAQQAAGMQQQQEQQQAVMQAPQGRQVHRAAAAAVAVPPPPPLPWQQAAVPSSFGQWLLAALAAAAVLAVPALRWLQGRHRQRSPQDEIREAEQRARAARLYDRQRQRFQRALLAAEDLEGADTSVFNAVSRKGSVSAAPPAAGAAAGGAAASAPAAASAGGAAGTGAAVLPPAAEAAVAEFVGPVHSMASIDAEDDGYAADGSTDVFDPASWDDETRKQWDAFVSSSKVNKGKLWDTNQVDEGLPAVWVDLNK